MGKRKRKQLRRLRQEQNLGERGEPPSQGREQLQAGLAGVKGHQKPFRIRTAAEFDLQRAISIAAEQMPDYRGFREEEQERCLQRVKMTFQRNQLKREKKNLGLKV